MARFVSYPTILWAVFSPVLIYCVFFTIVSKWSNPQEKDKDKDKAADEIAQLILNKWENDVTTEMLAGRVLKNWERKGELEGIVKRYVENWEYGYDGDAYDYTNEEV